MSVRLELNLKAKPKAAPVPPPASAGKFLPLQSGKKYVTKDGTIVTTKDEYDNGLFIRGVVSLPDGPLMYWFNKDTGRIPGVSEHHKWAITGEELSPFDKMVEQWMAGKPLRYRFKGGLGWSTFPFATQTTNPYTFIKGYEKQMEWEDLL